VAGAHLFFQDQEAIQEDEIILATAGGFHMEMGVTLKVLFQK
jgi:hypothetical protein